MDMASQVTLEVADGTDQLQVDNGRSDAEGLERFSLASLPDSPEKLLHLELAEWAESEKLKDRKQAEDETNKEFEQENRKYLVFAIKSSEQGKAFTYEEVGNWDVRQLREEFKKQGNTIRRPVEGHDDEYTIDINKYSMHIRYKLVGHHLDTIMGRVNGLQENWDMQAIPNGVAVGAVESAETKKDALGFIRNIPMPRVTYKIEGRFSEGTCNLVIKPVNGHIECVRVLAAQPGIELNKGTRASQSTALLLSSIYGHVDIVELLCSLPDIDVNKADRGGGTPHSRAYGGYSSSGLFWQRTRKIRSILEAKGAKPSATHATSAEFDAEAVAPLAKYKRSYTEEQIAANRAKVAPEGTGKAIYAAIQEGDAAKLLKLVEPWFAHPVLNDFSDYRGDWTPLIAASSYGGRIECVRVLVAQPGIEINKVDGQFQSTPLYCASFQGHIDIVELLCSLPGIDCNKASIGGGTPHSWACGGYSGFDQVEKRRMIRAILEAKGARPTPVPAAADPLAKYKRSYTEEEIAANRAKVAPEGTGKAIHAAAEKGDAAELLKLVDMWFAHPVLNEYGGNDGNKTPLIVASSKGPNDACKTLAKVAYEEVKNFLESFASELGAAPEDYEKEMDLKDLLALTVDLDGAMQILVKTPTGTVTLNDIYPSTKIKDLKDSLKDKIQDKVDIAPDQQRLFFGNIEMRMDNNTLSDYSIKKDSVLTLILNQVEVPGREEENNEGQSQPTHAVSVCCGCSSAAGLCCCTSTRPEDTPATQSFQDQSFLHPYIDVKKNAVLISFGDLRCVLTSEKLYLLFQENSTDHLAKLQSIIKNASYCFSKSLQRIGTTPRTESGGSSQQSVMNDETLTLFDEAMVCAIFLETNNMRQYVRMEALQRDLAKIFDKYKKMSYRISSDDLEAKLLPLRKDIEDFLLELRAQKQCLDEAMHRQNHLLFMNVTFLAEHQDIYLSGASRDILRKFDNGKIESQLYNALLRTRTCERKAVTAQSKVAEMMEHVESVKNDDQTTVLVVNTAVTILATCIGFAGYITGAFGMNLDQTEWLQTTPGVFQSVCVATLVFIAAGAPTFVVLLQKFNFLPSAFSTKDIDPEKQPRLDVAVAFIAQQICKPLRKRAGVAVVTTSSSKETKRASVKS